MKRRMTSRSVSLTSTFLLLAAGGVAACDNDDTQDEAFYCADENGTVVAVGFAAFGVYALARARYPDRDPSS